jgi:hypothetical protein
MYHFLYISFLKMEDIMMREESFTYRVTDGWLRDLASEPTPHDRWPCIHWDEKLLSDQIRFLDIQKELDTTYNVVWGLFINNSWPVPFKDVIDEKRAKMLKTFVSSAHDRGLKILSGVGIYSWGFDEVIAKVPEVSAGHQKAMCAFSEKAWDWQRRVLDFLMEPKWELDGISMQSADLGRCTCKKCSKLSSAEHHARLLIQSAEYVRSNRSDWVIGQASWGLRLDEPGEFEYIKQISRAVDYMVEVSELSASTGRRKEITKDLECAFGSVGGVFIEPPQHWDRLRWFVPCGIGSAKALQKLWLDGGRACEYFYRPFANPVEEVSWRTGAMTLKSPLMKPESALREAVKAVYYVDERQAEKLTEWFIQGENAYFSRSNFRVGNGSLSLEPLIWHENPSASGPAVYLRDRMSPEARVDYARELEQLKGELLRMELPSTQSIRNTITAIDGTLRDIYEI